jgi:quinol monooxygenase YgiN
MSNYLVTMEAQVPPDQEERLRLAYDHVMRHRPTGVVQSMLTRDAHDPMIWRIYTVWENHETLEAYYQSGALMPSAHVFHLVELEPMGVGSEIIASNPMVSASLQEQQHDQNDAVS